MTSITQNAKRRGINKWLSAILKRSWSATAKRRVWDEEYGSGRWTHSTERELIYTFLERYSRGGSILDLGCGAGATAFGMSYVYKEYVGVDISPIAVGRAIDGTREFPERSSSVSFAAADITTFVPAKNFDVILFKEVLYYFPKAQLVPLLTRYASFLNTGGVFIARFHDRRKHRRIIDLIRREFEMVEDYCPPEHNLAILAFRPVPENLRSLASDR
jgi:SAM-dependent methyltransferase